MKLSVKVFSELGLKIFYIKDINNYINLSAKACLVDGEYTFTKQEVLEIIAEENENLVGKFKGFIEKLEEDNEQPIDLEHMPQYTLCIHLSRKCNIHCHYCFGHEDYLPTHEVSLEVATKAIDFLVDHLGKNGNMYMIDLSGSGEPLLRFDMVKKIIEYCDEKRSKIGKNINVMFSTNATLMTKEVADYLNSKSNILLGVSLDGSEMVNDCNRVYASGKGTYKEAVRGIELLGDRGIGISATVTKFNENVDEIYDHLIPFSHGDSVSIHHVRGYDDSPYSFNEIDLEHLMGRYRLLVQNIMTYIEQEDLTYLIRLLRGSDRLGGYIKRAIYRGARSKYRCDAGWCRFSLDEKGELYTCSVMMGCEAFHIGNIYEGIDKEKRKVFLKSSIDESEQCKNCWAAYMCSGECHAIAYQTHHNLFEAHEKSCEYRKGLIKLSLALAQKIMIEYPQAYLKIYKFLQGTANDTNSNSAVWASVEMLKTVGIEMPYQEIEERLPKDVHGVKPDEVYNLLKEYIQDFEAFQLDETESINLDEIKYPFVAYTNKREDLFHRYAIVMGHVENNFLTKMVEVNEIYKIPVKEFLTEVSNIIIARA